MIDKRKALPLHYQVADTLRKRLKAGEWSQGQLFPPDKHWVDSFRVSMTTVRHALGVLAQEGWLVRQAGKGTFVQTRAVAATMGAMTDIFEDIRAQGRRPGARLLRSEKCEVGAELLARYPALRQFSSITIFLIELVLRIDQRPVCLIESYWPLEIGQKILTYDTARLSLHEILDALGIVRDSAEQVIRARGASARTAAHLDLEEGEPLLIMEQLFYAGKKAVEFSIYRYDASTYAYALRLGAGGALSGQGVLTA